MGSRHFFVFLLLISTVSYAADKKAVAKPEQKTSTAQYSEELFKAMKWRQIGPFRGGRVLAVEGIPGEPNIYYFGSVGGGVWKTTDGGSNWTPLFDKQAVSSIGAIAVAPSDHNVIYVGTGEACIRGNISYGNGMYRSMDGGKTWAHIGLDDTRHIGAVIVDPRDSNKVFVAALGHAFGQNSERGIFRTTDGGKTWEKVLYKDDKTGGIDIVFDPHNSNILFASLWEVQRGPYFLSSGGPGSGLYRSNDGGSNWKRLEGGGLPKGLLGRIGISVSGGDSSRVYALIENADEGGIYRSEDGGETWARVNDDDRYRQRAWYFSHIFADPVSPDTVYVLNTGLFRSIDGGKSFTLLPAPHGDHHGLWIDPRNPKRIINSNDGGVTITADGGKTWTRQDNQPTAQFYHVIADNRFPYYVYGAQQDNSTVGIATYTDHGVIERQDWYDVGGGESGYIAPDPKDPNIVYAGSAGGYLTRWDKRTEQTQDINPWPFDYSGHGAEDMKYRFQWTEPVLVSLHDHNVIYTAGDHVFKTTDQGMSWTPISDDLTRNDKARQKPSGGPITKDNTGVEIYDTVFTLAESPLQKGVLWAGTDDGLIHVTRDEGKTWTNVTPKKGLLEWSMISLIEASPHDAGTAYAAVERHKLDDFHPYIFKTTDFGQSWTTLINGIPDNAYVHAVREDPKDKELLYAGTESGIYVSFNGGGQWQPLQLNLPQTPIHDLIVHDDDLVAATHGRSFWVLDDITPLRQLSPQVAASDLVLFQPRPQVRLHWPEQYDARRPVGQNPPAGAIIDYYLKAKPAEKEEVTLEVLDSQGKLVRRFSNREKKKFEQPPEWPDQIKKEDKIPAEAGMNRFAWDLRYDEPTQTPGAFYEGNPPEGPMVLPGTYSVRMTYNGKSQTAPLEVRLDPRMKGSDEAVRKMFDLQMKVRDRISELHGVVNQIRDLRAQLVVLRRRLGDSDKSKPILTSTEDIDKKMYGVEGELIQYKMKSSEGNLNFPTALNEQFAALNNDLDGADVAPTQQQAAVFDYLSGKLNEQLGKWREIAGKDVPALNEMIKSQNIPVVAVSGGGMENPGGGVAAKQ